MKHTRWVNFYPPCDPCMDPHPWRTTSWNSEALARQNAQTGSLAVAVRVDFGDSTNGVTDDELDRARAIEAFRLYRAAGNRGLPEDPETRGSEVVATIAARLARQGWTPDVKNPGG